MIDCLIFWPSITPFQDINPGFKFRALCLHIAVDLINLSLHQVEITTDKEGESLDHYTLAAGDVVLIDRGYNPPKTLVPFIDRGGDVVLRYNPHSMNLYEDGTGDEAGRLVKIDWYTRLHRLGKRPGCESPSIDPNRLPE